MNDDIPAWAANDPENLAAFEARTTPDEYTESATKRALLSDAALRNQLDGIMAAIRECDRAVDETGYCSCARRIASALLDGEKP